MLTKGAVEDLIFAHLSRGRGEDRAMPAARKVPGLRKKVFLSDLELRRLYRPGSRTVTVPADAILSPLSMDWLDYEGVDVVRN